MLHALIIALVVSVGLNCFLVWKVFNNWCCYRAFLWILSRAMPNGADRERFIEQVKLELKLGYPLRDPNEKDMAN